MELEEGASSSNSSRSRKLKLKHSLSIRRCSNASSNPDRKAERKLKRKRLNNQLSHDTKAKPAAASYPDRKAKRKLKKKRLNNQLSDDTKDKPADPDRKAERKLKKKKLNNQLLEDSKDKPAATSNPDPKALDSISAKTKKRQDTNIWNLQSLWTREIMEGRWGIRKCQRFFARSLLFRKDDLATPDRNIVMVDFLRSCKDVQDGEDIRCAKSALAYYNKQNPSAEFELVETMYCNSAYVSGGGTWFHVNFLAKPKSASTNVCLKVFFAELNGPFFLETEEVQVPTCTCCVVDPKLSEVTTNCEMCTRRQVFHPVGAFPNVWNPSGTRFRSY